jgi:hypothetical protein
MPHLVGHAGRFFLFELFRGKVSRERLPKCQLCLGASQACFGTLTAVACLEFLWHITPMKKPRVIVRTAIRHQIYVERDGERTLYAVTDTVKEAKALVMKAKQELGIARGRASSAGLLQVHPEKEPVT